MREYEKEHMKLFKKKEPLVILNPEGLKEVHFYTKNLAVPIAIYVTSDWESTQVKYLSQNIQIHTSKTICEWCEAHHILFNFYYPMPIKYAIKSPRRYVYYLDLKKRFEK